MSQLGLRDHLIGHLKRFRKTYDLLRETKNKLRQVVIELCRIAGARTVRFGAARGFFSAAEKVRNGAEGRMVLECQKLIPAGPDSVRALCGMGQNGRQPFPIFWMRQPNARLVGESLALMDSHKRLALESVFGNEYHKVDPSYNYLTLPPPLKLEGPWTSVISKAHEGYFHWLADCLPRLALINEFPPDTQILIPAKLERFHRESLELMGLFDRCRPTPERHILIEDYYFASPTVHPGCDNPYAFEFLRKTFLPFGKDPGNLPRRFYVRRRNKTRGVLNEDELHAYFKSVGWAVLDMEEFSFTDQIRLFANADGVCSINGSALMNLVWSKPGCRAVELLADNFFNGCFEGITPYLGIDYHFLKFQADRWSRIQVDIPALDKVISMPL